MRKKNVKCKKANEEFVKTLDDSKYPENHHVTAEISSFSGMFDKEEDNYRKIAEKELKVLFNPEKLRHHMKAVMPTSGADPLVRGKPSAKPQNVN